METQNGEDTGTELEDMSGSLLPADGYFVTNSLDVQIEDEEVKGFGDRIPNPSSSNSRPVSQNVGNEPVSSFHPDQQHPENVSAAPVIVSASTAPAIVPGPTNVQDLTNDFIDLMIQKLRSLRTETKQDDVESNIQGEITESVRKAQDRHDALQIQAMREASNFKRQYQGYTE
jgi:hypothetical protein